MPQPSCITGINGAACGYFCERTGDQVACAATPFGACADKVACGFACVSSLKNVKCAETPWGTCTRSFDQIACWDPQFIVSPPGASSALAR